MKGHAINITAIERRDVMRKEGGFQVSTGTEIKIAAIRFVQRTVSNADLDVVEIDIAQNALRRSVEKNSILAFRNNAAKADIFNLSKLFRVRLPENGGNVNRLRLAPPMAGHQPGADDDVRKKHVFH